MAKYAQGFERKSSDTKNLIIMGSVIVGIIVLAIVGIIIYNKIDKKEAPSFASEAYSSYYLTSYDKLIDQKDADYFIYVCSKSNTSDVNMKVILEYLDKLAKGKVSKKLYLVNYDLLDGKDDSGNASQTETDNLEKAKDNLNYENLNAGVLFQIIDGELRDQSQQVVTKQSSIESKLNDSDLVGNKDWEYSK